MYFSFVRVRTRPPAFADSSRSSHLPPPSALLPSKIPLIVPSPPHTLSHIPARPRDAGLLHTAIFQWRTRRRSRGRSIGPRRIHFPMMCVARFCCSLSSVSISLLLRTTNALILTCPLLACAPARMVTRCVPSTSISAWNATPRSQHPPPYRASPRRIIAGLHPGVHSNIHRNGWSTHRSASRT